MPNRKSLITELDNAISRAKRNLHGLAVAFIDINQFKTINDNYSHDFGDHIIIATSKIMKQSVRETDFVARMSGDEFVVIFTGIDAIENINKIINDFAQKINISHTVHGINFNLTHSIGVALYPHHSTEENELLKLADSAMYLSKINGDGMPVIYNEDYCNITDHNNNMNNDSPMLN